MKRAEIFAFKSSKTDTCVSVIGALLLKFDLEYIDIVFIDGNDDNDKFEMIKREIINIRSDHKIEDYKGQKLVYDKMDEVILRKKCRYGDDRWKIEADVCDITLLPKKEALNLALKIVSISSIRVCDLSFRHPNDFKLLDDNYEYEDFMDDEDIKLIRKDYIAKSHYFWTLIFVSVAMVILFIIGYVLGMEIPEKMISATSFVMGCASLYLAYLSLKK